MTFHRKLTPAWRRGYRFQFEIAQNAYVVLYPEGMIKLNESAGAIGGLIDGARSIAAIIDHLSIQYPGALELGEDVEQFMLVARDKHWIDLV
ncbi:pyrroloquinoline quinone biosynthesis peptide chaperone PqqD (plasmid) [Paraburkholderia sprentiae WSM5005]|uniref:PqqA binding protein n=1 Tax=Paraburkholderia sprentiae WSM5005 TaxID=754502 RepID=A0A1I9YWC1_9BURK|nr:pyrroloquinoline quinone biosynthesis peptide chaperone PqqD [Paraburkholderia sprentiae]APA90498.1 pyrroloquinoline quinone biosynthesis peptide chaperone PqqD [Paraburkholderia sprentiae WSM5005]